MRSKRKSMFSGVRTEQQRLDTEAKFQITQIARKHPHLSKTILEICASSDSWTQSLIKVQEIVEQAESLPDDNCAAA